MATAPATNAPPPNDFAQWHRLDGVSADFQPAQTNAPTGSALGFASHVHIDVGRYATNGDAKGWFDQYATQPPLRQVVQLRAPSIGVQSIYYDLALPGIVTRVIYFEERNTVVRVAVLAPPGSALLNSTPTIAQQEDNYILRAH